jgi:hypothetical protein
VNIQKFNPISPAHLGRIRWRGERVYRVLSHSFSIRWNRKLAPDQFDYVWGGFAAGEQDPAQRSSSDRDGAPAYSLVDLGPPNRGRYRLLVDDQELAACGSSDELASHLLWQVFERMPEETDGFLLFHAGAVATPNGEGVLLPADSGFGKTTLVVGLVRAGFGFLSDETGVIDHHRGMLRPHPRALNFKEGSATLFPDLWPPRNASRVRSDGYLRAEEIRDDAIAEPCRIRFVIFPRYLKGAATEVVPLGAVEALEKLWANTVNREPYGARALPLLAEMVREVKSYRLVSGDLGEAVRAVVGVTGALERQGMPVFSD